MLGGLALALLVATAHAAPLWENIDQYLPTDRDVARVTTLTSDAAGNVYANVMEQFSLPGSMNDRVTVRFYDIAAGQWRNLDTFQYAPGQHTEAWGLTVAPTGEILVSGQGVDVGGVQHWFVRSGTLAGGWKTVMDYVLGSGKVARPGAMMVSGPAWFSVGRASDGTTMHAIVRRSLDAGQTWTDVADWTGANSWAAAAAPDGTLYVGTEIEGGTNGTAVQVWSSKDLGATWTQIDSYQDAPGQSTFWEHAYVNGDGILFLCGESDAGTSSTALVRRFNPATGEWKTVDHFQLPDHLTNYAMSVTGDGAQSLAIAVRSFGNDGIKRWVTRQSTDLGETFSTIDIYAGIDGLGTGLWGAAYTPFGNLFLGGSSLTPQGGTTSLIRTLVP